MNAQNFEVMNVEDERHVKMWTRGVPIEDGAKRQLANTARSRLSFVTLQRCLRTDKLRAVRTDFALHIECRCHSCVHRPPDCCGA